MKLNLRFKWHARRAGGLALGTRMNFPCGVIMTLDPKNNREEAGKMMTFSASFVCFTILLDVFYDIRQRPMY